MESGGGGISSYRANKRKNMGLIGSFKAVLISAVSSLKIPMGVLNLLNHASWCSNL